jgi:type VI protein secretion system component Hcp
MARMMETLESRQMFSVATDAAVLPAEPTLTTVDVAPTEVDLAKKTGKSSPVLTQACCTGVHFKEGLITV